MSDFISMRGQSTLAFLCLLAPATLLAWFHHTTFPALLVGTRKLWGTQKPLPTGFEFLLEHQFLVYLPLGLTILLYAFSWRFPKLAGPLGIGGCGAVLGLIGVLYAMLISTPALAHGLNI